MAGWWHRHWDLVLGIVLGLAIGLSLVLLFVFVFSEQAVDAPSVDGSGTLTSPATSPSAASGGDQGRQAPVGSP